MALRFDASSDFAFDKPAGTPCRNLAEDLRCTIHADLRGQGFGGCAVYDCQGAGQKVSQVVFGGRDWRDDPRTARWMLVVYPIVRALHEILAYVDEALGVPGASALGPSLAGAFDRIDALTRRPPEELVAVDVGEWRARVGPLLDEVSALARGPMPGRPLRGADLAGARLGDADLRRADLHGAYLIAADLGGADLRGADLRGADLRDADLRGADLTGSLFLTAAQLATARGDATTRAPAHLARPPHW